MITRHPGDFIEIKTDGEYLVFTASEYQAAKRRGEAVTRKRRVAPPEALGMITDREEGIRALIEGV